jgi:hypothetical protein
MYIITYLVVKMRKALSVVLKFKGVDRKSGIKYYPLYGKYVKLIEIGFDRKGQ